MIALIQRERHAPAKGEEPRPGAEIRGREWFGSIQGLRAVAMTLVFINHLAYLMLDHGAGAWLGAVRQFCSLGTDLFFCVAGAFVYRNLVREETGYWSFAGRRLRRVYPVYAFMLLLYLAMEAVLRTGHVASAGAPGEFVKNALLLPALLGEKPIMDASWALSYIVAFYLLSPLLYRPVRRLAPERRPVALAGLLGLAIGLSLLTGRFPLRVTLLLAGPLVWSLRKIRIPWPLLAATAAGGLWLRMADSAAGNWRFGGSLTLVVAIMLASFSRQDPAAAGGKPVSTSLGPGPGGTPLLDALFKYASARLGRAPRIHGLRTAPPRDGPGEKSRPRVMGGMSWWQRLLSLKPLAALGYRSYSFYLCHGLPLLAFDRYVFPSARGWELAIAAFASWLGALAFTEVVHRLVEVPWSLSKSGGDAGREVGGQASDSAWPRFAPAGPMV